MEVVFDPGLWFRLARGYHGATGCRSLTDSCMALHEVPLALLMLGGLALGGPLTPRPYTCPVKWRSHFLVGCWLAIGALS